VDVQRSGLRRPCVCVCACVCHAWWTNWLFPCYSLNGLDMDRALDLDSGGNGRATWWASVPLGLCLCLPWWRIFHAFYRRWYGACILLDCRPGLFYQIAERKLLSSPLPVRVAEMRHDWCAWIYGGRAKDGASTTQCAERLSSSRCWQG
jgi:hypothetical protein